MAKQSIKAGSRVVGRLKATMGKKGTILQVCGSEHKKRYVVQWNNGGTTTATAKGLQLDSHLKEAPVCSSSKRTRIDPVEECEASLRTSSESSSSSDDDSDDTR